MAFLLLLIVAGFTGLIVGAVLTALYQKKASPNSDKHVLDIYFMSGMILWIAWFQTLTLPSGSAYLSALWSQMNVYLGVAPACIIYIVCRLTEYNDHELLKPRLYLLGISVGAGILAVIYLPGLVYAVPILFVVDFVTKNKNNIVVKATLPVLLIYLMLANTHPEWELIKKIGKESDRIHETISDNNENNFQHREDDPQSRDYVSPEQRALYKKQEEAEARAREADEEAMKYVFENNEKFGYRLKKFGDVMDAFDLIDDNFSAGVIHIRNASSDKQTIMLGLDKELTNYDFTSSYKNNSPDQDEFLTNIFSERMTALIDHGVKYRVYEGADLYLVDKVKYTHVKGGVASLVFNITNNGKYKTMRDILTHVYRHGFLQDLKHRTIDLTFIDETGKSTKYRITITNEKLIIHDEQ